MNLVRAAAVVGSNTMLSRVLGFVRDVLMANALGAGIVSDAFFVAFKLANFLRRLFAEGAFNAAFVPMLSRALATHGADEARRFAGEALAGLALVLVVVVVLAQLFMAELVGLLAGGYGPDDPRFPLAVELSHITFPYILLISLAALLGGMLNAVGRFGAAAFAPVLLNVVLIAALLASPWLPVGPAHALAWAVAIAGVAQLAYLARATARAGMWPTPTRPRWNPRIQRLSLLVLPGALGAGVAQVNMLVDLWFASHLPPGAQSYLFYADRLNQLPLGVVGIAVGTALLPVLSRQVAAGDATHGRGTLNRAIQLALLLTLPATAALVLIAEPIVVGLFERGAFDAEASRATAATVQAFALGLPAYVLVKVMAPAFFAREDTRTPVLVATLALVANVALILVFIDALAHVGIALATALANWLNVTLLALLLARAGWFRPDRALASGVARAVAATLVMAAVLVAVDQWVADTAALVRLGA
ncbi:MAG: murein biosynthesis integral membrane protein MurJ, partial [Alphaproteobacteria bacterium]